MATTVKAKLGAILKTGDVEYTVFEGDVINDLVFKVGKEEATINGAVRVICAATKTQNTGPLDCPPEPYVHGYITPTTLIIDSSNEYDAILTRVSISDIVSIGSVTPGDAEGDDVVNTGSGSQYKSLAEVVEGVEAGTTVRIGAGTYSTALNIAKSLTLTSESGAKLTGKINIAGTDAENKIDVTLDSLVLSGDALIEVGANVSSFTMKNCTFGGHNITAPKTMPISITSEDPMLVVIEDNIFETEPTDSYNLIDLYCKLTTGSSISRNSFLGGCCNHNMISLYGLDDGAGITISENYAVKSANMIRIGFKGEPQGMVLMENNKYDTTDTENPEYAGLFLVQPYNTQTTSFAGVTIYVNNTTAPSGYQLGYIYAGSSDTPWTADNKPVIIVDGTTVTIPDTDDPAIGTIAFTALS